MVRVMLATNADAIVSAAIRAITSNEAIILFLRPKHFFCDLLGYLIWLSFVFLF